MFAVNRRLGGDFRVLWCGDFLEEDYYGYSFALFKNPLTCQYQFYTSFVCLKLVPLFSPIVSYISKRKVSWFCAPDVPFHCILPFSSVLSLNVHI